MRLPTPTFNIIRSAKRFVKEVDERSIREKVDSVQQGSAVEADVFNILCESQSDRMIQLELTMSVDLYPSEKKRRNTFSLEEIAAHTGASGRYSREQIPNKQDT
jgi:hypothetical protein